ncbi:MAG: restriction endonuclease, partial [Planctomycetes bacterium]|nr:restriction endonuclease [Planctomycetota bacterium]
MPTDHLAAVLEDLRKRIAKSKRDQLEQNTKATLIEPLLRALGWDTEDMDQVVHEYRRPRSKDNPVDYGLLVAAEPRLFV